MGCSISNMTPEQIEEAKQAAENLNLEQQINEKNEVKYDKKMKKMFGSSDATQHFPPPPPKSIIRLFNFACKIYIQKFIT